MKSHYEKPGLMCVKFIYETRL